jgi:hypothetical protein
MKFLCVGSLVKQCSQGMGSRNSIATDFHLAPPALSAICGAQKNLITRVLRKATYTHIDQTPQFQ